MSWSRSELDSRRRVTPGELNVLSWEQHTRWHAHLTGSQESGIFIIYNKHFTINIFFFNYNKHFTINILKYWKISTRQTDRLCPGPSVTVRLRILCGKYKIGPSSSSSDPAENTGADFSQSIWKLTRYQNSWYLHPRPNMIPNRK